MKYTSTFDASHKVKSSGGHAVNFERHIGRDVDLAAGFDFKQRNPNIDSARTHLNITMVNDGTGGFREPEVSYDADGKKRPPSAEFGDYLDIRLATVKRKLRDDAVIMRPLVLQLDPRWFAEHCPDWREEGLNEEAEAYTEAQLAWAVEEFGQENIVGFSVHMDEVHPQLQVMMTPVKDGKLSQKPFFKGPSDLQRQHKAHREALRAAGYEVEMQVSARSKEHLSSEEFARKADRVKAGAATLEQQQETLAGDRVAVRSREVRVLGREKAMKARKTALDERERTLKAQETEIAALLDEALDDATPLRPRQRAKNKSVVLTPARERHLERQQAVQRGDRSLGD